MKFIAKAIHSLPTPSKRAVKKTPIPSPIKRLAKRTNTQAPASSPDHSPNTAYGKPKVPALATPIVPVKRLAKKPPKMPVNPTKRQAKKGMR